ncbi:MAG: NAD(P)-dependent oxidoreductase [Hoeflea sp.]|uniref:NAD(P)-dependent oxidoreductase n=1 Tax=Hoeflea sp. TaxID=1940281 RepID=UPI001DDA8BC7|nr:NAD(P)-dependent oxidoreductase [Hoeflea sp.]MBU4529515.1 NAD(P)-dependent oxidoreductase [Alphaproteobacteria bacterium]MBU4546634.1 NAD(P)-dependent oxidoreductase [Alphaproteobacteria bacterium]MBU4550902.1 NAD(P)-dependent oxidoreductase [Alphaproteobacteria bacterium]MBV1723844.1 NAD(P)-dependent oxidoreductase [Hoeflea sp.]MBV1763121.1 NAD(P)-dependent oxidoreductase [Hoeflea sp.]
MDNPDTVRRIGFLGTGIMGAPMARNLARAGFDVTAWNRDPAKAAKLTADGVAIAATAAQAATGQDAVVVMLSSGPVCDEVLFGPGGAIAAMRPGALLIVMSSIPVETAKTQADLAGRAGIAYLDAPVSGGEVGAIGGSLSIMVGGSVEHVEAANPIFKAMGKPVHIGPAGTGALTKLVNQLTVASTIVAVAEALLLARQGGADIARVREALMAGFAGSRILDLHGQRMIDGAFEPGGPAKYQIKDTGAARETATALGLDLPMLNLADRLFGDLVAHGGGDLDHSAVFLELSRRNGLPPEEYAPLTA